ncbi:MAG: efflux RND transporter permease subunit [Pikeienuella sp.]
MSRQKQNEVLLAGVPAAPTALLIALMFQFTAIRKVTLALITISPIIVGALMGLLFFGQPLPFFAIFGLPSLMGIVINNAIALIDQIDVEHRSVVPKEATMKFAW